MSLVVAGIQSDTVWHDRGANFARLAPRVAAAAEAGAGLVLLPEMFACGFSMETDVTAEDEDGPTATWLRQQAVTTGAWVAGSVPERLAGAALPRNVLVLASPAGELHRYAKIHPFSYAGEHDHFASGDSYVVVEVGGLRWGLFVCYDLRFADDFWALADRVDGYLVPANWPAARREHWLTLLRARAIENQAYVVGVNRVGEGDGLAYAGDSLIVDPLGEVLASGGQGEQTIAATVSAEHVADVRARFPFLPDRRP